MKNWPDFKFKLFLIIGYSLFSTTGYTQEEFLRQTLGSTVNIIEQHTQAQYARLKVVSYKESNQLALKTDDRIAGYPVTGKLTAIDKEKSQQLTKLLLDKNNYGNIRQRCLNQYFHGIRFIKGSKKVEFAIGVPCNQVFVAFQVKNETKWWGSSLGNVAMKEVLGILPE